MDEIKKLIILQEERLRGLDKIDTCDYSLLHKEGRLWCNERKKTLVRAYCEICPEYKNEELGIGVN